MRLAIIMSGLLAISLTIFISTAANAQDGPRVTLIGIQDGDTLRGEVELVAVGEGFTELELIGAATFSYRSAQGDTVILISVDDISVDGFAATWDTTTVSDGDYVLSVAIVDAIGQESALDLNVSVDNVLGEEKPSEPGVLNVPGNFNTIADAIAVATPNSVIRVDAEAKSSYAGGVTLDVPGLALESVNGEAVLEGGVVLDAKRTSLSGFKIVVDTNAVVVRADDVEVRDNMIPFAENGIVVAGAVGALIKSNVMLSVKGFGIVLAVATGNRVEDNLVLVRGTGERVSFLDEESVAGGINLIGGGRNLIQENTLLFINRERDGTGGVSLNFKSSENSIVGNAINDFRTGVFIQSGPNNLIAGNVFTSNFIGAELNDSHMVVEFNDFLNNDFEGVRSSRRHNIVQNNFFEGNRVGSSNFISQDTTIIHNQYENNEVAHESWDDSVEDRIVITGNNFINNGIGIESQSGFFSSDTVIAPLNYWGDSSGPRDSGNPSGRGDGVIGDVRYAPWLTEPAEFEYGAAAFSFAD